MTGFERALGVSLGVVMVAAAGGFAQVRPVTPYYGVVTQDNTSIRCGPTTSHYSVGSLGTGTIVIADAETEGWVRVSYPAGAAAFVRADEASLNGQTVTLTKESQLRAASQVHGYSGSWQLLLPTALPSGTALALIEPVKEGEIVVAYKVQAPSEARGFVGASRVRTATQAEVDAAKAKGQAVPALTDVKSVAIPETQAAAGTPAPAAKTVPFSAAQQTQNGAASTDGAATPAVTTVHRDNAGESLEPIFRKVWEEPILSSEVDELIGEYERAIEATASPRRKAGLTQRLEALKVRREYRETLRRQQADRAALDAGQRELQKQLDQWASSRVYTLVGVLQPSTVYDGERLPLMYRVVSVGGSSPRTLGYIRKSAETDLDRYLGSVVGVIGESSIDRSLQLNLITPVRVDPLRSAPESALPQAEPKTEIDMTK
ncbi:MAG TPA: hypothetical protein VD971_06485 [Phycisphaerales bacterium]|nr:hypothetical protein [Phycisphaerales bacterium]